MQRWWDFFQKYFIFIFFIEYPVFLLWNTSYYVNRTGCKWQHVLIKWIMYRLGLVSMLSWSLETELQNSTTYNSRKILCFLIFPQYWFQTIHCALFTINNSHEPFSVMCFILHMNVIVCLMVFFLLQTLTLLWLDIFSVCCTKAMLPWCHHKGCFCGIACPPCSCEMPV